jgi:cytochrome P450
MKSALEIRAEWLASLRSTEPTDRARAEAALRELYIASELPAPGHFFRCDSPYAALWAMALLTAEYDALWRRIVEAVARYKRERELMERIRTTMCQSAALPDLKSLAEAAGKPMALFLMHQSQQQLRKMICTAVTIERLELYEKLLPHQGDGSASVPNFLLLSSASSDQRRVMRAVCGA